jgi:hypothetical protein
VPDGVCVLFEEGKPHVEVSLPMRVLYHGKVYLLSVSDGHRQGLILTKQVAEDTPQKK